MSDQTNNEPSVLDQLVGEGKKFKTTEDLAKGKLTSDNYIQKLEGENEQLRGLVTDLGSTMETLKSEVDFLKQVRTNQNTSNNGQNPPAGNDQNVPPKNNQTQKGLTDADVIKLVETREREQTAARNGALVKDTLVKEFGADADTFLKAKAEELNLPVEYLVNTGRASPQALFNLIGLQPGSSKNAGLSSYVPSTNKPDKANSGIRNKAWYDAKMKEMGAWKFATDKNMQIQMNKDMMTLGDRWDS